MPSSLDLMARAALWNAMYDYLRTFFAQRGYTEVRTPLLVRTPGMEPYLDPLAVDLHVLGKGRVRAGFITSPEYAMKKLLGGGMKKIYTVTPVFRNSEELGNDHAIEFTMLEWYRQGANYRTCMEETEALVNGFLGWEGTWPRLSYVQEFTKIFGTHPADITSMDDLARMLGDRHAALNGDTLPEAIAFAFQTLVLPQLMQKYSRFFLTEYPAAEASLAQKTTDGRAAERFEAYCNGMELCNGFTELVDPHEQRARFIEEQEQRRTMGKEVFPIDEELLAQLSSVASPSFGNALGIDRLVMLKAGTKDINSIHLFPPSERFH